MTNKKWFQEKLLECDLSQRQLSEKIGLDPGAMSRTIAGRRRLQIDEANAIALIFNTSLTEVLMHFGLTEPGALPFDSLPIIAEIKSGGVLTPLDKQDSVPALPNIPSAKYVAQWRDDASVFDGWLFYLADDANVEIDHLAALKLTDGTWALGVASRSYVPGQYQISLQGGGKMDSGIAEMRRVLAIIPV